MSCVDCGNHTHLEGAGHAYFIPTGRQGQLLCMGLCRPLDSLQLMHTIMPPSEPCHMLSLSPDFFLLSHAHELQLWDTCYCTCQCSKAVVCSGSKVSARAYRYSNYIHTHIQQMSWFVMSLSTPYHMMGVVRLVYLCCVSGGVKMGVSGEEPQNCKGGESKWVWPV